MNARDRIAAFWETPPRPLGGPGFALPDITGFAWHALGDATKDNWVVVAPETDWSAHRELAVSGDHTGNVVVYGRGSQAYGEVQLLGDDNLMICGEDNPYHFNATAYFCGDRGLMFFGARSTSNEVRIWTHGTETKVLIGEDVMIAHAVMIRTSDDHAIVDLETGAHLNAPRSIQIDPHVWLCPEVHVLKGVRIGYGSIIAERSVVTGPIARCVLAAGVPARTVRERVSWDRPLFPRPGIHRTIATFPDVLSHETGP